MRTRPTLKIMLFDAIRMRDTTATIATALPWVEWERGLRCKFVMLAPSVLVTVVSKCCRERERIATQD